MPLARMVSTVTMVLMPGHGDRDHEDDDGHGEGVHGGRRLHRQRGVGGPAGVHAAQDEGGQQAAARRETTTQKLMALSRGNAMSLAPIMIGMMKLAKGPVTMMMVAMIITMPWMDTMAL